MNWKRLVASIFWASCSKASGDYDGAFAAFERMNEIGRDDPSSPEQRGAMYRQMVRDHRDLVTPTMGRVAGVRLRIDDRPSPAFLVGFPRSGTTLLDTILMGHPRTEVLEEEPTLHACDRDARRF